MVIPFIFHPYLLDFNEDHKECLLKKVEQFFMCSFRDIYSQSKAISIDIWN